MQPVFPWRKCDVPLFPKLFLGSLGPLKTLERMLGVRNMCVGYLSTWFQPYCQQAVPNTQRLNLLRKPSR